MAGASSGVGLATARAFAEAGDSVHAAARRAIDADVTAHVLDVTDREGGDALAAQFESLDVLVISAGANIPRRRLHELTFESWDQLIDANLTGAFNLVHAFLDALRGGGADHHRQRLRRLARPLRPRLPGGQGGGAGAGARRRLRGQRRDPLRPRSSPA